MYSIKISIAILLFWTTFLSCDTTEEISILNTAMQKSFNALVVVPEAYRKSEKRFPVIYLLHGYSGNYKSFSHMADLEEYADSFSIIVVCPDGNYNSWYLDSPVKKISKFKTYIIQDVIGHIDSNYRTIASAKGRAIVGTSMGGHGALTLLALHPDVFCGAGSISGILDLTPFPEGWEIPQLLGPYNLNKEIWKQHSFIYLIKNLIDRNKGILIDCGTDDFALFTNHAAHRKMEELGIFHEYYKRPGGHTYHYVMKVIGYHIAYFARRMDKK